MGYDLDRTEECSRSEQTENITSRRTTYASGKNVHKVHITKFKRLFHFSETLKTICMHFSKVKVHTTISVRRKLQDFHRE